ncbi:hypothetical protein T06_2573 [Trichinella sp. T6]|nr:hypothetical protein T06_8602 [Trichinella sp. T6]KRX73988.1 hypothetical protein T06_2573 [Trichinella sp. T6]
MQKSTSNIQYELIHLTFLQYITDLINFQSEWCIFQQDSCSFEVANLLRKSILIMKLFQLKSLKAFYLCYKLLVVMEQKQNFKEQAINCLNF